MATWMIITLAAFIALAALLWLAGLLVKVFPWLRRRLARSLTPIANDTFKRMIKYYAWGALAAGVLALLFAIQVRHMAAGPLAEWSAVMILASAAYLGGLLFIVSSSASASDGESD